MTRVVGATLAVIVAVVTLAAAAARAEHRVYFRYVLLGYVTDAAGRPLKERRVSVIRDKTGFSYLTETDAEGLYVAVVRLGDESAGETLTIRVGDLSATIAARFNADNHREERGTRVDLLGQRFLERPAAFRATLARYLSR